MPSGKEKIEGISEKLKYLGLDLDKIPDNLREYESLGYRVPRVSDEKKYRQYRYIPINQIQIMLSPTNRLSELSEKYKKARPLIDYLDNKEETNLERHTTFLHMLKNMNVEDIEKVYKEQINLNKKIPFKVKYQENYLWQIFYSENTDKYFMIVPTEDVDCSAFFFILKRQIHNKGGKIFVPVCNAKYSNQYLRKNEFEDIENYLWLFTKSWPTIYEVYDKNDELSIHIIGETEVYEKVKTTYKIVLNNSEEASEFYKLLKALFILQTDLPNYFKFTTNINLSGSLEFYLDGQNIKYKNMIEFIREQYKEGLKRKRDIKSKLRTYNKKLKQLKQLATTQEIEYLAKEKQISTFLECKKSFFGKFKYYFKYSKKTTKTTNKVVKEKRGNQIIAEKLATGDKKDAKREMKKIPIKKVYTLEELITNYKELEDLETTMKKVLMDINALKLKTKNLAKKIENATLYIQEIDSHKKSIFEFWKYSNKDEISVLPEGEEEEVNVVKKIDKVFNFEEDFEEFGKKLDKLQRKNLNKEDTDSVYIAATEILNVINKIRTNNILPDELEESLANLKRESKELKSLNEEEYDIFGNIIEDSTKIKKIKNKTHRETAKDKYYILEINKNTKQIGYKLALQMVMQKIFKALEKGNIPEKLPVYMASRNECINNKEINVFNLDSEGEMKEALKIDSNKLSLFKLNVKEGTKGIGFTNIIYYDNQNKTLPLGMDLSTKMVIDTTKLHLKLIAKASFNVLNIIDEKNDFSDIEVKEVNVCEYEIVDLEDIEIE